MIIEEKEKQPAKKTIEERWNELNTAVPDKKDSNRRATAGAGQWVQDSHTTGGGTNTSGQFGHSVQRTDIDTDLNGAYFQPIEIKYTPANFKYNPDDPDGLLAQFKKYAKKPEWDAEREKRLKAVARINALGDLFKHLGAFAGGGYAPVEKRQENKNVLRAFAELDKMRDLYDNRMDRYNDKREGWLMTGLNTARQAHEAGENRRLQTILKNADYKAQARNVQREAELRNGTITTTDNYAGSKSAATNYQDGSRTMAVPKGSGSGSGSANKNTVDILLPDGGVAKINKGGVNRANLATMARDIELSYPGSMPLGQPVMKQNEDGEWVAIRDEQGNIMRRPLTDDEYWEYIVKYAKDVSAVVDRLKTLEDGKIRGGKEGRSVGEVPQGATATPAGPSAMLGSIPPRVSPGCIADLNKIVGNGVMNEGGKRKAIIDRLKQEGYSKEEVKRIVESITVE